MKGSGRTFYHKTIQGHQERNLQLVDKSNSQVVLKFRDGDEEHFTFGSYKTAKDFMLRCRKRSDVLDARILGKEK